MKQIMIITFGLLLISGCLPHSEYPRYSQDINDYYTTGDENTKKEDCEPKTDLQVSYKNCPEGCFKTMSMIQPITEPEKWEFSKDYDLEYPLYRELDNCGLDKLYYAVPNGSNIYIYDENMGLLGGFWQEERCEFEERNAEWGNLILQCHNNSEDFDYKTLQEPERYLTYEDCE